MKNNWTTSDLLGRDLSEDEICSEEDEAKLENDEHFQKMEVSKDKEISYLKRPISKFYIESDIVVYEESVIFSIENVPLKECESIKVRN